MGYTYFMIPHGVKPYFIIPHGVNFNPCGKLNPWGKNLKFMGE
jgi:hypothetical protein